MYSFSFCSSLMLRSGRAAQKETKKGPETHYRLPIAIGIGAALMWLLCYCIFIFSNTTARRGQARGVTKI